MSGSGRRRARMRVLALGSGLLMVSALLVACAPPNRFYQDPAELPGFPGGIVRSYVITPSDYNHHVLLYQSTNVMDEPILVSGTVLVPREPWEGEGPRPLVTFASATQGIGDGCVPSKNLANGIDQNLIYTEPLLARGYAVAISDYEGLGTNGPHTFGVADSLAFAVLDMARAALNFPQAGLDPSAPVAIVGYSQGGQAAARAAEIESWYAPELNVVAAAAGGVPAYLADIGEHLNAEEGPFFALLAFTAFGFDAAYPELDLDSYLTEEGSALFADSQNICMAEALLNIEGPFERYTVSNPLDDPAWQARVDQQTLGRSAPKVPTMLTHPLQDQIVPLDQGTRLRDSWCEGGAAVHWYEHDGEHIGGSLTFVGASYGFVTGIFERTPVIPSYCN